MSDAWTKRQPPPPRVPDARSSMAGNSQTLYTVFQKRSICVRVFGHVPEGIYCTWGWARRRFVEFSSRNDFSGTGDGQCDNDDYADNGKIVRRNPTNERFLLPDYE